MVEGPGCKLKGEGLGRRAKGKVVVHLQFFTQSNTSKENDIPRTSDETEQIISTLIGKTVDAVRTLGKELYIFFSNSKFCIRIHFLMEGTIRFGKEVENVKKNPSECNLLIKFSNDCMVVCKSAVSMRPSKIAIDHCNSLQDVDICSPVFNFTRAVKLVQQHPSDIICDVVMDQLVLPGVGNIIKNEGLFKAGIHPNTKVVDLSEELIRCLVHRLRDFSSVFYICRKEGKSLKSVLCMYEKDFCTECGTKITVCKPGRLSRLTFFCSKCQVNDIRKDSLSLPKKNTLLGFLSVMPSNSKKEITKEDMWECEACTFINISSATCCKVCLTVSTNTKSRIKEEHISLKEVKGGLLRYQTNKDAQNSPQHKLWTSSAAHSSTSKSSESLLPPLCTNHQEKCAMRRVLRAGENKGRPFYACCLPKSKQCRFFQWADLHYPLCDHGKTAEKRRVLKLNVNNGREFYCCRKKTSNQCGFFQWV